MPQNQNITLYVMSQKGLGVVKALTEQKLLDASDLLVIGRDKNVLDDYADKIIDHCKKHKLKFEERKDHKKASSTYTMAISWRWMLPPTKGLIILHDSLLPKYRGFLPLVSAIMNSEKTVGVTALFANDYYDSGDIIAQAETNIEHPIRIQDLINLIEKNYQELSIDIVQKIKENKIIEGKAQDHSQATYSLWRDQEDYRIDWSQSAEDIQRFIFAVGAPYQGASSLIENNIVRIFDAELFPDKEIINRDPGKVIFLEQKNPVVVCGNGLLKLTSIQDNFGNSLLPLSSFRTRFK